MVTNMQTSSFPLIDIMSYDMDVRIRQGVDPFQVDAILQIANRSDRPTREAVLYLHPELAVTSVQDAAGAEIEYISEARENDWSYHQSLSLHRLALPDTLPPGGEQVLRISYTGGFSPSTRRSPSDFMRIDAEGAFLRGLGYSLWFPVTDPKAIDSTALFHIRATTSATWIAIAFGRLVEISKKDSRHVSTWRTPSPFKLIQAQLFAGPYSTLSTERVSVFSIHEGMKRVRRVSSLCDALLDFYHARYGAPENPTHHYIVETCPYGCIASGNVIGLSPTIFAQVAKSNPGLESLDLIAHELVHGFAVPLIERHTPGAALLLEGFPSYFHVPAATAVLGECYREWFLQRAWESYRSSESPSRRATPDGSVLRNKPLIDITVDDIPSYKDRFLLSDKFPILLDRIRVMLGDEAFFASCGDFFSHGATRSMTFCEFISALELHSGRDLSDFYDRWFASTEPLPADWEESSRQA